MVMCWISQGAAHSAHAGSSCQAALAPPAGVPVHTVHMSSYPYPRNEKVEQSLAAVAAGRNSCAVKRNDPFRSAPRSPSACGWSLYVKMMELLALYTCAVSLRTHARHGVTR